MSNDTPAKRRKCPQRGTKGCQEIPIDSGLSRPEAGDALKSAHNRTLKIEPTTADVTGRSRTLRPRRREGIAEADHRPGSGVAEWCATPVGPGSGTTWCRRAGKAPEEKFCAKTRL